MSDLTNQNVLSYQFTLTYNPAVLTITGATVANTLSSGTNPVVNTNTPGQVTVSWARSTPLSGSGTLINLQANFVGQGSGNLNFSNFQFNEGTPTRTLVVNQTTVPQFVLKLPASASGGINEALTIPVTVSPALTAGNNVLSYQFTVNYDPAILNITGVSIANTMTPSQPTVNTATAGQIRVAFASATPLTGSGTLINLTAQLVGVGTSALTFTNVQFNEGTPMAGGIGGNVTVGGNQAPTFTATLPATQTIAEGSELSFEFVATDPEGANVTLSLTQGGATPNATLTSTGNGRARFVFKPSLTQAGTYNFTIRASDGVRTTDYSFAVTVTNLTFTFTTNLAGVHEAKYAPGADPVQTPASGTVTATLDNDQLTLTGSFQDLSAGFTAAHIHTGAVGVGGGVVLPLNVTAAAGNRSGTFNATAYNLNTALQGTNLGDFTTAIKAGRLYVNVHSMAYPAGEIRGQLLATGNQPPSAPAIASPANGSTFNLQGKPTDNLFTLSFSGATDPNGNDLVYLYQISTKADFSTIAQTLVMPAQALVPVPFSVDEAHDLLLQLNVPDVPDAKITLYHRLIASDGSLWTVGAAASVTLVHKAITGTEGEALPTAFALKGNYPNPFNPATTIRFDLPETADVSVMVVDLLGRVVMNLPVQSMAAGANQMVELDAASLASGTYIYQVVARGAQNTSIATGKMTLLK